MTQDYTRIPATGARAGDEVHLAGAWHVVKAAYVKGDRVTLVWPSGGRTSGPAHHYTMRRPEDAPAEDDTLGACGCRDYHLADCPTRAGMSAEDHYARMSRDDYYGAP